jgi:hypothetical protein
MKALLARVLKGLPIRGGSVQGAENDIANWLRELGEIEQQISEQSIKDIDIFLT